VNSDESEVERSRTLLSLLANLLHCILPVGFIQNAARTISKCHNRTTNYVIKCNLWSVCLCLNWVQTTPLRTICSCGYPQKPLESSPEQLPWSFSPDNSPRWQLSITANGLLVNTQNAAKPLNNTDLTREAGSGEERKREKDTRRRGRRKARRRVGESQRCGKGRESKGVPHPHLTAI